MKIIAVKIYSWRKVADAIADKNYKEDRKQNSLL